MSTAAPWPRTRCLPLCYFRWVVVRVAGENQKVTCTSTAVCGGPRYNKHPAKNSNFSYMTWRVSIPLELYLISLLVHYQALLCVLDKSVDDLLTHNNITALGRPRFSGGIKTLLLLNVLHQSSSSTPSAALFMPARRAAVNLLRNCSVTLCLCACLIINRNYKTPNENTPSVVVEAPCWTPSDRNSRNRSELKKIKRKNTSKNIISVLPRETYSGFETTHKTDGTRPSSDVFCLSARTLFCSCAVS